MRLSDLHIRKNGDRTRAVATVHFEMIDRPAQEIFIETEAPFAGDLAANPHAFVVGCLIPALYFGERRIALSQAICPRLKEGLQTVMAIMRHWTHGAFQPLAIEAPLLKTVRFAGQTRHPAIFLSGGMDSLAALKSIMDTYPRTHPAYPRDALIVHGFDIGGVVARGAKTAVFERARTAMAPVAADAGLTLIPLYTNIRHLCDDRDLWLNQFFGAVLAAVAHALAPRIDQAWVASSYCVPHLPPCGSHPLLDPQYGSVDLAIGYRDIVLPRMRKIEIVAGWDTAFQNFRVCLANVPDRLNCGRCEKCVRTMMALEALGLLKKTRAFVEDSVDPAWLDAFSITVRMRETFYIELIEPLRKCGRRDLATKIEEKLMQQPECAN